MKVVVNFIYGYENLSGEKYKTNEKRISSIGHTSYEKNPKNYPKTLFFRKVKFSPLFPSFYYWLTSFSSFFWLTSFSSYSFLAHLFFLFFLAHLFFLLFYFCSPLFFFYIFGSPLFPLFFSSPLFPAQSWSPHWRSPWWHQPIWNWGKLWRKTPWMGKYKKT